MYNVYCTTCIGQRVVYINSIQYTYLSRGVHLFKCYITFTIARGIKGLLHVRLLSFYIEHIYIICYGIAVIVKNAEGSMSEISNSV